MPYVEMGGFPRRATLEGKIEESASHHVIKCNEIALETIRILFHMHFPLKRYILWIFLGKLWFLTFLDQPQMKKCIPVPGQLHMVKPMFST